MYVSYQEKKKYSQLKKKIESWSIIRLVPIPTDCVKNGVKMLIYIYEMYRERIVGMR